MSVNLTTLYAQQFATNIQLLLQQKGSKLRDLVMSGTHVGSQASPVDQIGSVAMQPVTGRFGPIGRVDASTDRRWVFPSDFDLPQMIDSFDKLRLLTDPSSAYVQNAVNAAGRQMDDLIIAAFFGTAKTGIAGGTSTTFPSSTSTNTVPVNFKSSGNVGLTVAKVREAKRMLKANLVDVDADPVTMILTSKQEDDLMGEMQVISLDYNDRPVLVDGKVSRLLGINVIQMERLANDATPYRRVPVFAKSGMYLGIWNDITTDVDKRKDLTGHPWQAYVYMTAGATRLEEGKTVEIKCNES